MLSKIRHWIIRSVVSVIAWDFDGTFYQSKSLDHDLQESYRKFLERALRRKVTRREYLKLVQTHGSISIAASRITGNSRISVIDEVDRSVNKSRYIHKNSQMVELVTSLSKYRHVIFSNAAKGDVLKGLKKVGFMKATSQKPTPFEAIIDRHSMRYLKPDRRAFQYLHKYTNEPKWKHLVIGDSFHHDILPAQTYGFWAVHITGVNDLFYH